MSQASWKKTDSTIHPRLLRLLREAAFYVLVAVAVYLLMSLWTYNANDPSWSHRGPGNGVANMGGRMGAWLSDVLYSLFGYTAYLLPFMIAIAGWRVYQHRSDETPIGWKHRVFVSSGFLFALIGACGLASLHFKSGAPFSAGGWFGNGVGFGLAAGVSFTGATIFLLAMFLSGVTLFSGLSWLRVMDTTGRFGFVFAEKAKLYFATLVDRLIGMRARKQRRDTVEEDKKVLAKHAPPRIEPVVAKVPTGKRIEKEKQVPLFDTPGDGELPPLSLLDAPQKSKGQQFSKQSLESMARLLEKKLLDFGIEAQVVAVHPGPVITLFEIEPAAGVKAAQITALSRDLARALSVVSVRVVENIAGKTSMGIEIPNEVREIVRLSEVLASQAYEESTSPVSLALGKDISGHPVVVDLSKMPHLLIAGTTGSGKSVCINSLILSLVYKATPENIRFIMIDPKMLEL